MAQNIETGNMQRTKFTTISRRKNHGFTLIELVIVMTILAILVTVALPVFMTHIRHAREVVLMQDLMEMRHAIDNYITDKEKAPQSFPKDPIGEEAEWQVEMGSEPVKPGGQPGIENVRSGASGTAMDGRAYSEF
jgi:general secretion pathway protein G